MIKAIIDYTRRSDPACCEAAKLLTVKLAEYGYPTVLHFWTKAPAAIALLYKDIIKNMQNNGTCVVSQVTLNNYGKPLEYVSQPRMELKPLVDLLGSSHIRLRFDPIIIGTYTLEHYQKCVKAAVDNGISRITVNFLNPQYEKVDEILKKFNVKFEDGTEEQKITILKCMRNETPKNIEVAVCAESSKLLVLGITKASCADPTWFKAVGANMIDLVGHTSRKGCGCFYTKDWGEYPSRGGFVCPHKCLYCYAKHNIYAWSKVGNDNIIGEL